MIYMEATITIAGNKMQAFSDLVEKSLRPAFEKYGAKLIGSWETFIGTKGEAVDLWAFDDMGHFQKAFQSFIRDPSLSNVWPNVGSIVHGERWRILSPLPCSPLK